MRRFLFYRLVVVPLDWPLLSKRHEDLDHLINLFMAMLKVPLGMNPPILRNPAMTVLKSHSWPGNIRELRNLCERLSILLAGKVIQPDHLPAELLGNTGVELPPNFTLPQDGLNLEALEADLIQQALERTRGNQSKSAKLLGLTRDTLLYRMNKYGFKGSEK